MRKKWIFFALAPLFSFAAAQEEWLSESTFPIELKGEYLKNKEVSSLEESSDRAKLKQRRAQRMSPYKKSHVIREEKKDKKGSEDLVQISPKESQWKAFLERLTLKKGTHKTEGELNIVTNRKPRKNPYSEEEIDSERDLEEEQQKPIAKKPTAKQNDVLNYHNKAREKISAENETRTEERALKRKSELLKKNNRRVQ